MNRLLTSLLCAFIGSLIAISALVLIGDSIRWHYVYFAALLCGILGFFLGQRFIDWLGELLRHMW